MMIRLSTGKPKEASGSGLVRETLSCWRAGGYGIKKDDTLGPLTIAMLQLR